MTTAPISFSIAKGKQKIVSCNMNKKYPFEGFNIEGEGPTQLLEKDDHYLVNCLKLGVDQLDFVATVPKKKYLFYLKQQSHSKYRYIITNCFFKTSIDSANVVLEYENKIVNIIEGFRIPTGLPWHLTHEVYVHINCNGEFHWVLVVIY
ncbi:hypothetical protein H5410_015293 [Solanum commersonii]|uniref:Uncharacterized protein n=1 Tax=Solanum commersonii TaxID=4109 RepID=A0A9J5ZT50_SOLCO|nr:hypothetical protein H5410_015293 [Solanum commersonii]